MKNWLFLHISFAKIKCYVPLAQRKLFRPVLRGSSSTHLPTNDGIGPLHDTSWQNVNAKMKTKIFILLIVSFLLCILGTRVRHRLAVGLCHNYRYWIATVLFIWFSLALIFWDLCRWGHLLWAASWVGAPIRNCKRPSLNPWGNPKYLTTWFKAVP